jgi:hypothetical protein
MIISGKVKAEQVFAALADMENKICSKVLALNYHNTYLTIFNAEG